jgi:LysR family hydrogen peroxide-inducible transcriptional activator
MPSPITLRQLRYAVAVADEGGFGRAAEACHVSQPSLSAQIRDLEAILGTPVFERTSRRVAPTPLGERILARARRVLAEVEEIAETARAGAAPLSGEFRLGVIPTLGPYYLPKVLPALRAAHPDLKLYLREERTARLIELLLEGRLEGALLALPVDEPALAARPLFDEPFVLAAPPGHPLAEADRVGEAALAAETVLLLEDGHCFRDQALAVCSSAGAADHGAFAASSLETLREMVAGRIGVTLLPALAAGAGRADVVERPLAEPAPTRTIALVGRKVAARDAELAHLADFLRAHLPAGVTAA